MSIRLTYNTCICILFMLIGVPSHADSATTLDHAAVSLEVAGAAPVHVSDARLPYHWDRLHGAVDGSARFVLTFSSDAPETPQAIYIPRVGNTFEIRLNGALIGKRGTANSKAEDFAKQPHFFPIPAGILQRDKNSLDIAIDAQGGRDGGLSPVLLGPEDEVRTVYASSYRWRVTGSLVIAIVSIVLGSVALVLWFRQRESLYFYYAASELLWALYMSNALLERLPLPWPWWDVIFYSAFGLSIALICKFALQVMGLNKGILKQLPNWLLFLTVPAILLQAMGFTRWIRQIWGAAAVAIVSCIAFSIVRHGVRSQELEKRIFTAAVIITAIAGVRDYLVRNLPYTAWFSAYGNSFDMVPWQRYAWLLCAVSMAWIIAERMRKSTLEIANMNQTLSRRLAERETELSAVFAQRANYERQQAALEERQRLMRDMHDGLGSQLLGTLHLAQNPAVTREALTGQLRETLDQLKMTVDAMQDTEGDIASLLGALRYRLGPRLQAAGVQLSWSVEALPTITGWTLQHSRDLQMILYEAFSNLIAHAGASHATLSAAQDIDRRHIQISLHDNGRDFDGNASTGRGHGINNMRLRAARINAQLRFENTSGGTMLIITVPLG